MSERTDRRRGFSLIVSPDVFRAVFDRWPEVMEWVRDWQTEIAIGFPMFQFIFPTSTIKADFVREFIRKEEQSTNE